MRPYARCFVRYYLSYSATPTVTTRYFFHPLSLSSYPFRAVVSRSLTYYISLCRTAHLVCSLDGVWRKSKVPTDDSNNSSALTTAPMRCTVYNTAQTSQWSECWISALALRQLTFTREREGESLNNNNNNKEKDE